MFLNYYFYWFPLLFILLAFAAIVEGRREVPGQGLLHYRTALFCFFSVGMILLSGFRPMDFGADDDTYYEAFIGSSDYIDLWSLKYEYEISYFNMEHGFVLYMYFLKLFGSDQIVLFLSTALITIAINAKLILKFSPYALFSLLIYFSGVYFQKDLNQIRFGLVSALAFLSAYLFLSRRNALGVMIYLLGVFIHIGSALSIVSLLFSRVKLKPRFSILLLLFSVFLSGKGLASYLINLVPKGTVLGEKLAFYLNSKEYSYQISLVDPVNMKNIFLVAFFSYFYKFYSARFNYFYFFYNLLVFYACFRIVFSDFAIVAARIAALFSFVDFILIPMMVIILKPRLLGKILLFTYCCLIFSFILKNPNWSDFSMEQLYGI